MKPESFLVGLSLLIALITLMGVASLVAIVILDVAR